MRKRWIQWFAIPILLLLMCAICSLFNVFSYQISGIKNFAPEDSTISLSQYLFPCEDFLTRFSYCEGDYQYYYNGKLDGGYATAFSYLRYDLEEYENAKDFCIREFSPTDCHCFHIGDYIFVEHLCYASKNEAGNYVVACQYPYHFNMYAYNDKKSTLLFLGFYFPSASTEQAELAHTDFEAFFAEHFSQYYSLE